MKSGEHQLWDAHMAMAPVRARWEGVCSRFIRVAITFRDAFTPAMRAAEAALRQLGEQLR